MKIPNIAITWADFPGPCYSPQFRYGDCPETLLKLLTHKRITAADKIWAFAHCRNVESNSKRFFAIRCVRDTPLADGRKVVDLLTDHRSINAIDVAERYAFGSATKKDLTAAADGAIDVVYLARAGRDAALEAASLSAFASAFVLAAAFAAWHAARAAADAAWHIGGKEGLMMAWGNQVEIIKSMLEE